MKNLLKTMAFPTVILNFIMKSRKMCDQQQDLEELLKDSCVYSSPAKVQCSISIFTDILRNIQEQMQEERREKEKKQWKKALNSKPQTHEQRVEHLLTVLTTQVSTLTEKVNYLQEREAQCTCGAHEKVESSKKLESIHEQRRSLQIGEDFPSQSHGIRENSKFRSISALETEDKPPATKVFSSHSNLRRKTTIRQALNLGPQESNNNEDTSIKNSLAEKAKKNQSVKNLIQIRSSVSINEDSKSNDHQEIWSERDNPLRGETGQAKARKVAGPPFKQIKEFTDHNEDDWSD